MKILITGKTLSMMNHHIKLKGGQIIGPLIQCIKPKILDSGETMAEVNC